MRPTLQRLTILVTLPILVVACQSTSTYTVTTPIDRPPPLESVRPEILETASYTMGDSRTKQMRLEKIVLASLDDPWARSRLAMELVSFLHAEATPEAHLFACRQLALIGDSQCVPYLAPLLLDSTTADMARYALEGIPGNGPAVAMTRSLSSAPDDALPGIINSIGRRGTRDAIPDLQPYTESDDAAVRDAAEAAISKIRSGR